MRPTTGALGAVIRRHRERQKLTLEQVARAAGITSLAQHNLETSKSSSKSDTYERVSEALHVDYAVLVMEARLLAICSKKNL